MSLITMCCSSNQSKNLEQFQLPTSPVAAPCCHHYQNTTTANYNFPTNAHFVNWQLATKNSPMAMCCKKIVYINPLCIKYGFSEDAFKRHFLELLAILLPFILSINLIFVPGLSSLEDRGKGGGQDGSGPDKPDSDFRQFHYKPASSESKSKLAFWSNWEFTWEVKHFYLCQLDLLVSLYPILIVVCKQ